MKKFTLHGTTNSGFGQNNSANQHDFNRQFDDNFSQHGNNQYHESSKAQGEGEIIDGEFTDKSENNEKNRLN